MTRPKLTDKHENGEVLGAVLNVTPIAHSMVMGQAAKNGWVVDQPGVIGGLITRKNYMAALAEVGTMRPEVLETIRQNRARVRERERWQARQEACNEQGRGQFGIRKPQP